MILFQILFHAQPVQGQEVIPTKRLLEYVTGSVVSVKEIPNIIATCGGSLVKPFHPEVAHSCESFMDSKGKYGLYGSQVAKQIIFHTANANRNEFLKSDFPGMVDGSAICPNWNSMPVTERLDFWVWTFGSIAHVESSCDAYNNNAEGTNGIAVGLFQLDEKNDQRYFKGGIKFGLTKEQAQRWGMTEQNMYRSSCDYRGSLKIGPGEGWFSGKVSANINCAVDIMHELLRKESMYGGNGQLFGAGSTSYWQELRNYDDGGKIGALVRAFPKCQRRY